MREKASDCSRIDMKTLLAARLSDAALPPDATDVDWKIYYGMYRPRLWLGWREQGAAILARWITSYPGTRPSCWWEFDAPRAALGTRMGQYECRGSEAELRKRVGGCGTPLHEVLHYLPAHEYGVPVHWVTAKHIEHYSKLDFDPQCLVPRGYEGSNFPAQLFDPADPPHFESQASYLKRHNLLSANEERRLTPDDFQEEALLAWYWPDEEEDPA